MKSICHRRMFWMVLFLGTAVCLNSFGESKPFIFPLPQRTHFPGGKIPLNEKATICIPTDETTSGSSLAQFLVAELVDKYQLPLSVALGSRWRKHVYPIVMGTLQNPLVNQIIHQKGLTKETKELKPEGYLLWIDPQGILIAGKDEAGAFYGLQSLRQLIFQEKGQVFAHPALVVDWPLMPFRGIRLMLPGPENLTFFKRFLKDFMAFFKYNKVIIESNANIRLKRHPELNAGAIEFYEDLIYSRRDRPTGPHGEAQDSAHHDAGDGTIVEAEEVRSLVRFAESLHIEVIPEIPCLTHCYYMLTRHRELAEIENAEWPDTYCPSNPESYALLFDIFDELIEVMHPKTVNVAHDEWRMAMDVCPRCKGKDYRALFLEDFRRIYNYFNKRDIRVAMWADHLFECVRNDGPRPGYVPETDYIYQRPGALTAEQVEAFIPKDVLIFNWCWNEKSNRPDRAYPFRGEHTEKMIEEWGFEQVFGNMTPNISNYDRCISRKSLIGGAPSAWMASTPLTFGKDLPYILVGCANRLWSSHYDLEPERFSECLTALSPVIRYHLTGRRTPSMTGDPVLPLNLSEFANASSNKEIHVIPPKANLKTHQLNFKLIDEVSAYGNNMIAVGVQAEAPPAHPLVSPVIPISKDVSSLLFLHACAKPARNQRTPKAHHNYEDTADLLGWYEIRYQDGFITTIPLWYGINILEWNAKRPVCYLADPVVITTDSANHPVYYYAYEWTNERLGKAITSIQLNGTQGFKDYEGDMISENAIYLIAVSHVERRSPDDSHRARFDLSHSRQQVLGHSGKIIGYSVQEQHL